MRWLKHEALSPPEPIGQYESLRGYSIRIVALNQCPALITWKQTALPLRSSARSLSDPTNSPTKDRAAT